MATAVHGSKDPQAIEGERPARPQETCRKTGERGTVKAGGQTEDQRGDRNGNGLRDE